MTNDKPASDGGADDYARVLKQLEASIESSKNFNANIAQLSAAAMEAVSVKPKRVRMTVEEQYNAERGIKKVPPIKKPSRWSRWRSAISGLFVSKKYAEANPDTTIREKAD